MNLPTLVTEIQSLDTALCKRAMSAVNISLTARNWLVGAYIVEFEQNGEDRAQYGKNLIPKLAQELDLKGLGVRNLEACRKFYQIYPQISQSLSAEFPYLLEISTLEIPQSLPAKSHSTVPQVDRQKILTQLSFSHIVELLKIDDPLKRTFYEIETIKGRWSVRDLKRQTGSLLFERTGLSKDKEKLIELANTGQTALAPQDIIRDPYIFEFLGLRPREVVEESDLESALLDHLQAFILELGRGFCFEDRQRKILIGTKHYFIDLVFYHRLLKCHVLIDLKVEPFTHENAGQLNTYLNWYRKHQMQPDDNPPVGILLCTDKETALAEYALGGMDKNLFVSDYQLQLPDPEELRRFIEHELATHL